MGRISSFVKSGKGKATAGITGMGVLSAGMDGVFTYAADRAENPESSQAISAAKAAGTAAAWLIAEPLMWGITIGQGLAGAGEMMIKDAKEQRDLKNRITNHVREDQSGAMGGTLGGNFVDNQQVATMRQRQMNLLHQHRISTESILGSEARQLHR